MKKKFRIVVFITLLAISFLASVAQSYFFGTPVRAYFELVCLAAIMTWLLEGRA